MVLHMPLAKIYTIQGKSKAYCDNFVGSARDRSYVSSFLAR